MDKEAGLLILLGGWPGRGKATLTHQIAERMAVRVIRSEEVRKEMAGLKYEDTGGSKSPLDLVSKKI